MYAIYARTSASLSLSYFDFGLFFPFVANLRASIAGLVIVLTVVVKMATLQAALRAARVSVPAFRGQHS